MSIHNYLCNVDEFEVGTRLCKCRSIPMLEKMSSAYIPDKSSSVSCKYFHNVIVKARE